MCPTCNPARRGWGYDTCFSFRPDPCHRFDLAERNPINPPNVPKHCRLLIYGFLSSNSYRYKDEDIVRTDILASFKDDAFAWVTVELTESMYYYPHERVRRGTPICDAFLPPPSAMPAAAERRRISRPRNMKEDEQFLLRPRRPRRMSRPCSFCFLSFFVFLLFLDGCWGMYLGSRALPSSS
jgi:hypothetical protein